MIRRILTALLACVLAAAVAHPAAAEKKRGTPGGPESTVFGRDAADYTGVSGYAVISAEEAKEIDKVQRLQNQKLWRIPTYERSGSGWTRTGTVPHKTEVFVKEQIPAEKREGMPDGYLLVEDLGSGESYYIDTDHFLEKEQKYTARDGTAVYYHIYFPETAETAEKLPVLIYFHGNRDTLDKHHGVGELLRANETEARGIVILPQAVNGTKDRDFHTIRYQDAVIELAGEIAGKYNGDMNRLSVSGHSDGGVTAYQIVNMHPGIFAACAPISAIGTTNDGIRQTWLWVFQGKKDFWVKENVGLRVVLKCEAAGCNAMHYVYKNEGHNIQTMVYQDVFADENGREVKLIDWLMSKELGR